MYLSIYPLSALLNVITSLFLGFFVFLRRKENPVNKAFFWFCIIMILWSGGYFLWQLSDSSMAALLWSRVLMAGAIFIPITYLVFLFILTKEYKDKLKFIILSYFLFFLFFILNFTPYFVKGVESELSFGFWPKAGIAYHPFLLIWFIYVLYTFYFLAKKFLETKHVLHTQLGYILFGTVIGYLGGSTNYFLWYGIQIPPFGNSMITVYMLLVGYAIFKYQLFDIRVIATEFLVALIGLGLFIDALLSKSILEGGLKGILFILVSYGGYHLVLSVREEIKRRQQIQELTDQLKKANIRLKELDRLKSEFLSVASHELNSPMSIILGYLHMILYEGFGKVDKNARNYLQKVYFKAELLAKLVRDLLNVSRIEQGRLKIEIQATDLGAILKDLCEDYATQAKEKGLKFDYRLPTTALPKVLVDPDKLKEIIQNLLSNAVKFTKEGGITVEVKEIKSDGVREILTTVKDTGIGIPKEAQSHIGEKFYRVDNGLVREAGGTGLGLHLVRQYLELMKGKLWFESEGQGKGTTFYFTLPVAKS